MKLTKRIISFLMAVLMLCSGMVVTAFAGTDYPYELDEDNCYVDVEKVRIIVDAATVVLTEGEEAVKVEFTALEKNNTQAEPLEANFDKDGNTIFPYPVTGKTYIVEGFVGETSVTNKFEVKVLKSQNAPAVPSPKKVDSESIELNSVSNCEYRIEKNGAWSAWQATALFTGLKAGTAYKIEMRYKETSTHYASTAVSLTVKTLDVGYVNAPDEVILVDKTEKTLTVEAYEIVYDGDKYDKANGEVTSIKEDSEVLKNDKNEILYVKVTDVEFSIDSGKTWQATGVFAGLKADSTYNVIVRYTYDKTEREASANSVPKEFITNARESYPADLKKCTFKAADGDNYANETISFTVVADTAPAKYEAQYGDTRYVPAYYTVSGLTGTFSFNNPSKDGKTYTASFIPGDANANKKVEITVYYQKQKCHGEDDNGKAVWSDAGEIEKKTYKVNVGEVHNFFTDVKNFFLGIFNALFNTIPAVINGWLSGFDFSGVMEGAAGLLEGLGGLTGTTNK